MFVRVTWAQQTTRRRGTVVVHIFKLRVLRITRISKDEMNQFHAGA